MPDYTKSAFFKVRKFLIQELYDNNILQEAKYTESSPVVPVQQIPEAEGNRDWAECGLASDAPYIAYDIVIPGGYDTEYWNCREEVMLWAYDYDLEKLFEIKEFLYDLFRRFDMSADDINVFEDGDNTFQFHYFDIMMGLPTDEIDQIVGRYGINMVISYEYSRQIQSNGRFA